MKKSVLVIACGALAKEIVELQKLNSWTHVKTQCLPAELHNTPDKIPPAVRSVIEEYRDQLENMNQKLELLVTDINSHSSPGHLSVVGTGVRAEDIEIAFLREKQKRSAS